MLPDYFPSLTGTPVYTEEQEISMGGAGSSSSVTGGGTLKSNFGNISNQKLCANSSSPKERQKKKMRSKMIALKKK